MLSTPSSDNLTQVAHTPVMRKVTRVGAVAAAGCLASLGVAIAATHGAFSEHTPERASAGVTLPYVGSSEPAPPGQPCDGATVYKTIDDLVAATATPVYAPAGRVPSKVWTCGRNNPALGYGNLEVNFRTGWGDINPDSKWAGMVAQSGGRVETLLGRPAWVRPADDEGTWPSVDVIVNGTLITVLGAPGASTEDVVTLANSIPAP